MCFLEILILKFIFKRWKLLHLRNGQPVTKQIGKREGWQGNRKDICFQKFYKTIWFLRRRSREPTFWLGKHIVVFTSCNYVHVCCWGLREGEQRNSLCGTNTPPPFPPTAALYQASLCTQGWEARQRPAPQSSSLLSFWLHGLGAETFLFKNDFW